MKCAILIPALFAIALCQPCSAATLEEAVLGSLLCELPYSFPAEAARAQAIAARTLICAGGDELLDSSSEAELCKRFGETYARRSVETLGEAVSSTVGEVLLFDGEPIYAAWHSSSPGMTEASENVWQSALPYLIPVESEETPRHLEVTLTVEELSELLPEWDGDRSLEWQPNSSGRCGALIIGSIRLSGTEARRLFGLTSTALTARWDGELLHLTSSGYGHGVGLSQYGALEMAERGCTYREILAHYYPGCELGVLDDLSGEN